MSTSKNTVNIDILLVHNKLLDMEVISLIKTLGERNLSNIPTSVVHSFLDTKQQEYNIPPETIEDYKNTYERRYQVLTRYGYDISPEHKQQLLDLLKDLTKQ